MTSANYNNFVQSCFRKIYGMLDGADTIKVKRKQGLAIFGFLFERIVELSFVQL